MNWAAAGSLFLAVAVGMGAFGAHALRPRFDAYQMDVWEKAVFYHFIHALGLLIAPALARTGMLSGPAADRACWLLAAGILLFSGSLYTLALSRIPTLGAVTPLGGVAFLGAWLLLAWGLLTSGSRG